LFLFILENLGTQELILIAGLALIIFGPRKLPDIVKTISKTIAQFKNATNEFKSTWEKEVEFDEVEKVNENLILPNSENSIYPKSVVDEGSSVNTGLTNPPSPEIKELSQDEIERIFKNKKNQENSTQSEETAIEPPAFAKRDWL
jgi:Tat protein translocase TatB subunit